MNGYLLAAEPTASALLVFGAGLYLMALGVLVMVERYWPAWWVRIVATVVLVAGIAIALNAVVDVQGGRDPATLAVEELPVPRAAIRPATQPVPNRFGDAVDWHRAPPFLYIAK